MRTVTSILISICLIGSLQAQDEGNWRLYTPTKAVEGTGTNDEAETAEIHEQVVLEALPTEDTPAKQGEIRYIQDERISILDDYLKTHPIKHEGYRIQLIFGSRGVVSSAKSKFVSSYNYSAYEDYLPPNFRLRIGDFLTRFQAEKVLREINGRFPKAYIVRDKIEVPREYR